MPCLLDPLEDNRDEGEGGPPWMGAHRVPLGARGGAGTGPQGSPRLPQARGTPGSRSPTFSENRLFRPPTASLRPPLQEPSSASLRPLWRPERPLWKPLWRPERPLWRPEWPLWLPERPLWPHWKPLWPAHRPERPSLGAEAGDFPRTSRRPPPGAQRPPTAHLASVKVQEKPVWLIHTGLCGTAWHRHTGLWAGLRAASCEPPPTRRLL